MREKRSSTDFCESLEDGDRIYLYHQNKRVLNGRFVRPGTSAKDVCLVVPEDKRKGNPEMVLSYDNLKLFFRSNFRVDVYRPFEKSPYAYYPRKLNGVETPIVPY